MTEKPAEQQEVAEDSPEPKQEVADSSERSEEPKQEIVEDSSERSEEPKPGKITVPPKKKQKDPKKVAQGKRLAQISERAKREKMRREIEEETQIDFSVDYRTLLYFGVPSVVFAGLYLYFSDRNRRAQEARRVPEPRTPPKKSSPPKIKKNVVSLFD